MSTPKTTTQEKLAALKTKRALAIAAVKSKRKKERQRLERKLKIEQTISRRHERKQDTRRKIIAGAVALSHAEHDEQFKLLFYNRLRMVITKQEERELLGLDILPETAKSN